MSVSGLRIVSVFSFSFFRFNSVSVAYIGNVMDISDRGISRLEIVYER